jgi:predicted GIY-YIG superfamily endonuclease
MSELLWFYMIECDGGGIYVGIANDVEARYQKREQGKSALYSIPSPKAGKTLFEKFPQNVPQIKDKEW